MTILNNNPAARLLDLLTQFRQNGERAGSAPLHTVWNRTFDLASGDINGMFERLVEARNLACDVRVRVENRTDGSVTLHLKHYPRIESLLAAVNLAADWRSFAAAVDDLALGALAFTADWLGRVAPEPTLSEEEIKAVVADLDTAREQIRVASIDPEVRRCLLSALDAAQYALARYRTAGIEAFHAAWVQMLGSIGAEGPEVAQAVDVVLKQPAMSTVASIFQRVGAWAHWARRAAEGAQPVLEVAKAVGQIAGMLSGH